MSDAHAPAWRRGWWHGATFVESHGHDEISRLPDGSYVADLLTQGGYLRHGPVETLEHARACCRARCACWQPERKALIAARRAVLEARYHDGLNLVIDAWNDRPMLTHERDAARASNAPDQRGA